MAALALFDVLTDFARPSRADGPHAVELRQVVVPAKPAAPEIDVGEIVRGEVSRAETQLEGRLQLAHEAEMEALRQNHAQEMQAMLRQFGEDGGAAIAARLAEMEARLGALTTSAAARILGGILSDHIQKRAMESLVAAIREAIADTDAVRIQVRGPQSLYETLRLALAERADSLDYVEASGFDLTVTIDGNLYETRISEWSAALAGILA